MNKVARRWNRKQQRQDRHFEKAVVRRVKDDAELEATEEEIKRKLAEIENDDDARGSSRMMRRRIQEDPPDQDTDRSSNDVRGTKGRADEDHEEVKSPIEVIVSCV